MAPNMLNYEEECRNFKWNIPEYFNFGFDIIDKRAKEHDKLALVSVNSNGDEAQKHTFGDLSRLSNQFANVLAKHGIKKGERVLIITPQIPEWYVAVLGCIKQGVVFTPTPSLCTAHDMEYRIKQCDIVGIVAHSTFAERFEEIKDHCPTLTTMIIVDGEREGWTSYSKEMATASTEFKIEKKTKSVDPMLIYFTSGTTGFQKMVLHTHGYALAHEITAKYYHDLNSSDLHWTIADPGWAKTAWGKLFGQWILGAAVLQHDTKGRFHPEITLKVIETYEVTTLCAPPTAYRMLVQEDLGKYNFSKMRHWCTAGEPITPETMREWEEKTGRQLYDAYGQTESVLLIANYPCMPIKPGSMGKPAPGHTISIIDDEGNELPVGVHGNVGVKVVPEYPPGLLANYWRNHEAMVESFRGDWYYTGDLAWKDEDGYYWFIGRADDVIKSSGYRIGPFEVESALQEHHAVAESAAVGVPDPVRGEIVKAFVVLRKGYTGTPELARELQDNCKRITAPYKYPRKIEFVTELPKTISGKIMRSFIKKQEAAKMAGSGGDGEQAA